MTNRFKCPFCGGNIRQQFPSLRDVCEDCGMEVRFDDKNDSPQRMTKTNEWESEFEELWWDTFDNDRKKDEPAFCTLIQFVTSLLTQKDAERADWLRSEIEKLEGEIEKPPVGGLAYNRIHRIGMNTALTSIITRYKEELLELDHSELDQPNQ